MSEVYLLLGSNLGDRKRYIDIARDEIQKKVGRIILHSSIWETEPWGFIGFKYFLNQVIVTETSLKPFELLETVLNIEKDIGRIRKGKSVHSRIIDIDILFYDQLVINNEKLKIPHPEIPHRMFNLVPLAEINDQLKHPVLSKTIRELKNRCKDLATARLYTK